MSCRCIAMDRHSIARPRPVFRLRPTAVMLGLAGLLAVLVAPLPQARACDTGSDDAPKARPRGR